MKLTARQVSFVKTEMKRVEEDNSRQPTVKKDAEKIKEEADKFLTE